MHTGDVPGEDTVSKASRMKTAWIAAPVLATLAALGIGAALALPNAGAQVDQAQEQQAPDADTDSDAETGDDGPDCEGHGRHGFGGMELFSTAAETIGVDEDALRDELESGKSLAQIAEEHGVSTQALTDALVAAANAHIDEKVAAGDLSADEAAEKKADVAERIADMIQQEGLPAHGHGRHGPHERPDDTSEGDAEPSSFERV